MQTGSPCALRRQSVVVLVPQLAQIIPVLLLPLCNVTISGHPLSSSHVTLTLLLDTLVLAGGLLTVAPVAPPPVLGLIPFILL